MQSAELTQPTYTVENEISSQLHLGSSFTEFPLGKNAVIFSHVTAPTRKT